MQAQIICHDMQMSNDEVQEYQVRKICLIDNEKKKTYSFEFILQKLLTDYKDFRSVIAAFLAGCQLMNEDK